MEFRTKKWDEMESSRLNRVGKTNATVDLLIVCYYFTPKHIFIVTSVCLCVS